MITCQQIIASRNLYCESRLRSQGRSLRSDSFSFSWGPRGPCRLAGLCPARKNVGPAVKCCGFTKLTLIKRAAERQRGETCGRFLCGYVVQVCECVCVWELIDGQKGSHMAKNVHTWSGFHQLCFSLTLTKMFWWTWTSHIETSRLFTSLTPSWFSHITNEALALTLAYQDRSNKIITDQKLCKEDVNWEGSNCTFVKHTHQTVGIIHLLHDFLLALLIGVSHTAPNFTQLPFKATKVSYKFFTCAKVLPVTRYKTLNV